MLIDVPSPQEVYLVRGQALVCIADSLIASPFQALCDDVTGRRPVRGSREGLNASPDDLRPVNLGTVDLVLRNRLDLGVGMLCIVQTGD